MNIKITDFGGINPLLDNKKLPQGAAQKAENCLLSSGRIEPFTQPELTASLDDDRQQTIYLHKYRYNLLTCGPSTAAIEAWQGINDGAFTITADGAELEISALDFGAATDMDGVAAVVQAGLRKATTNFETVVFDTANNCFIVNSNRAISFLSSPTDPEAPATVTDISGELYLNGQDGTAVLNENLLEENWLSWDHDVDVVDSTVNNDRFERLYYTGDGSGKLKVRGNFGERIVNYPEPPKPDSITKVDTILAKLTNDVVCKAYLMPSVYVECTTLPDQPHVKTSTGYILYFHFPGWYTDSASVIGLWSRVYQIEFSNGEKLPLTLAPSPGTVNGEFLVLNDDDGEEIGIAKIIEVENFNMDSDWDPIPETATKVLVHPSDFKLTIEMSYAQSPEDYYYVQRYVDDTGAEGPPGELSAMITRNPGEIVNIGSLGDAADIPENMVKRRLYRSAGTAQEAGYYFLTELDVTITEFVDKVKTSTLAEKMPPFGNPVDGLCGLVTLSNGFYAAFKGRDIYFSEPYQPYAWPWKYSRTVDHDIVGLASLFNSLVVMTAGKLYIFNGSSPEVMNQVDLSFNQACVSKRGICRTDSSVYYPSPDGLVRVNGGRAVLITENIFSRDDWQALKPETMIAESYENRIHAFMENGAFIFDFDAGHAAVTTTDERCSGLYSDIEYDHLYLIQGTGIKCWRENQTAKKIIWKSKAFEFPRPISWSCARVIAEDYPTAPVEDEEDRRIKLRIFANGNLVHTATFYSAKAIRLPLMRPENEWEFELETFSPVDSIALATSMREV